MAEGLFQRRSFSGATAVSTNAPGLDDRGIALGDTAAIFQRWDSTTTSLTVWRREPSADVGRLLDELPIDRITGWRKTLDAAPAGPVIAELMASCGIGESVLERFLAADIALLTRMFATATGTSHLEARLDIIRDDACRRFHVDNHPARLVVTYVGPGTVCAPRCHGEQALAEQQDYSGPLFEIPQFSVGLFAGEGVGRAGLVHRSPRIAGTGLTRLFFCVNAVRH